MSGTRSFDGKQFHRRDHKERRDELLPRKLIGADVTQLVFSLRLPRSLR